MSNPFVKLKVEHDSDSEEEFKKVKSNKPVQQLFVSQEQKKKKKRPENQESETQKEEEEGFEEVSKHKPQRKKVRTEEGEEDYESTKQNHYAQKEGPKYYPPKTKKPGKREFERKSGTGRGKEVSKGGAGGKGTWGDNPKEISRKFEKNYDEYYIDKALRGEFKEYDKEYKKEDKNDEKKDDKNEEKNEDKNEEKNEEKNDEKKDDKNEKEDEKNENVKEGENENYKGRKGRKDKKDKEKVVNKEDLLTRPENAQSLDDYLKEHKKEEEEEEKKVERPKDSENLTVLHVEKSNEIGVSEVKKKKGKKHKEKKNENNQDFSNVFDNLKIGESGRSDYRPKEKKGKFKFDPQDFPKF